MICSSVFPPDRSIGCRSASDGPNVFGPKRQLVRERLLQSQGIVSSLGMSNSGTAWGGNDSWAVTCLVTLRLIDAKKHHSATASDLFGSHLDS